MVKLTSADFNLTTEQELDDYYKSGLLPDRLNAVLNDMNTAYHNDQMSDQDVLDYVSDLSVSARQMMKEYFLLFPYITDWDAEWDRLAHLVLPSHTYYGY